MSSNKRSFQQMSGNSSQPRVGSKQAKTTSGSTPGTSPFYYDTGRSSGGKLLHQVKYGPGIGFSANERGLLHQHYGTKKVTSRYTQYNPNRTTYVNAAQAMGRGLTVQELDVSRGRNPGPTSIDHIIASGTGQHMLNRTTLEFLAGRSTATSGDDLQTKFSGIAQQAAAIGRMRSIGREILREESRTEGYGSVIGGGGMNEAEAFVAKRNRMAKDLHKAFDQGSEGHYKRFMKHTFDSTGNLRLGHSSGNSRVSTGFDMPLDRRLDPTQRGIRLFNAYRDFGYSDMQTLTALTKRNNAGMFTSNQKGQSLSSSRQVGKDTVDHRGRFQNL